MPTVFLKYNIHGVRVPQFKLDYIHVTTHTSHKYWLGCFVNFILCGGETNSLNFKSGIIA